MSSSEVLTGRTSVMNRWTNGQQVPLGSTMVFDKVLAGLSTSSSLSNQLSRGPSFNKIEEVKKYEQEQKNDELLDESEELDEEDDETEHTSPQQISPALLSLTQQRQRQELRQQTQQQITKGIPLYRAISSPFPSAASSSLSSSSTSSSSSIASTASISSSSTTTTSSPSLHNKNNVFTPPRSTHREIIETNTPLKAFDSLKTDNIFDDQPLQMSYLETHHLLPPLLVVEPIAITNPPSESPNSPVPRTPPLSPTSVGPKLQLLAQSLEPNLKKKENEENNKTPNNPPNINPTNANLAPPKKDVLNPLVPNISFSSDRDDEQVEQEREKARQQQRELEKKIIKNININ